MTRSTRLCTTLSASITAVAAASLSIALAQPPAVPATPPASTPATPAPVAPAPANPAPTTPVAPPAAKPAAPVVDAFTGTPVSRADLPSGVTVEDFVIGTGVLCSKNSPAVFVQYRTVIKGKADEVDSSYKRSGKPIFFRTSELFPGLSEGIIGMHVGGKRRISVPAKLALDQQELKDRAGKVVIPAGSDLIIDVSLEASMNIEDELVGSGEEIKSEAEIKANYVVKLAATGVEVERSKAGEPAPFRIGVGAVIPGWDLGIPGMKVGGKRNLYVPWQMAYGEKGRNTIPPRADLLFNIEAVEIVKPKPDPATAAAPGGMNDTPPPPTPAPTQTPARPD